MAITVNIYYSGTNGNKPIATGSVEEYAVNNIYNMAGNVWDWTIEALNTSYRVGRGGNFYVSASSYPSSSRNYGDPTNSYSVSGSRVALYM